MRKIMCCGRALFGLLISGIIGWSLVNSDSVPAHAPALVKTSEPTYQSEDTTMVLYNQEGGITYTLAADHVHHFGAQKITWFTRPVTTIFNEDKVPTWRVKADNAKLTQDRILYLYGKVQVDNLTNASLLKRIRTDNAVVNMATQDFSSDEAVTLYGSGFNSTGMKMRGNLRNKTAELIDKVKTYYETNNLQIIP